MPTAQKRPQGGGDALRLHTTAIGRVPLLRPEQVIKLRAGVIAPTLEAWAFKAGLKPPRLKCLLRSADRARNRVVLANLRLVCAWPVSIAVERFDPSLCYHFSTDASRWIREHIGNGLVHRSRTIRLPSKRVAQLNRLRWAQKSLDARQDLQRKLAKLPAREAERQRDPSVAFRWSEWGGDTLQA